MRGEGLSLARLVRSLSFIHVHGYGHGAAYILLLIGLLVMASHVGLAISGHGHGELVEPGMHAEEPEVEWKKARGYAGLLFDYYGSLPLFFSILVTALFVGDLYSSPAIHAYQVAYTGSRLTVLVAETLYTYIFALLVSSIEYLYLSFYTPTGGLMLLEALPLLFALALTLMLALSIMVASAYAVGRELYWPMTLMLATGFMFAGKDRVSAILSPYSAIWRYCTRGGVHLLLLLPFHIAVYLGFALIIASKGGGK